MPAAMLPALALSVLWIVLVGAVLAFLMLGFNRYLESRMADDVLRDWELHLASLEPDGRDAERLTPPPHVIEALVSRVPQGLTGAMLPSRR